MRVCAIIAAAGSGSRMKVGKNKLLIDIKGKTVIKRTLEAFEKCDAIDGIILVCGDDEIKKEAAGFKKIVKIAEGGSTRQKSVWKGLEAAEDFDIIAVHDGARCFVSEEVIKRAVECAKKHGACVPVIDVIDTIKEVNDNVVCGSVDREKIKCMQTPQCFKKQILLDAYKCCEGGETDESSLVSKIAAVHTVEGSRENIKITTKYDLAIGNIIAEGSGQ